MSNPDDAVNEITTPQSILADLVTLAPKATEALQAVVIPDTDVTWKELSTSFRLCIAWALYWQAKGDCPDLTLLKVPFRDQLSATILDAARLDNEKLLTLYPEQKAALERLQRDGAVFSKGWMLLLQLMNQMP